MVTRERERESGREIVEMGGDESSRPTKKQRVESENGGNSNKNDKDDDNEKKVTDDDMQPEEKSVIKVKVLFFASAREAAGDVSSIKLEMKEGMKTADLRKELASRYPKLSPMVLDEDNLTLALNEEYVTSGQNPPLNNGDTIALIPPISGG